MSMIRLESQRGIVLVAVLSLLAVLMALMGAFFLITNMETGNYRGSRKSTQGFYAAEAGLNMRAEEIRQIFVGYNRPSGTPPTEPNACVSGNMGAGNYVCRDYSVNNRTAQTYVIEEPGNPIIRTIPPGELYQNLNAQEYRYTVKSSALGTHAQPEALLELHFKSRLVPLFQFVAFYDKDLEILPGPSMNLSGPVHTNGDLYLTSDGNLLSIAGQVTTAGRLFRGRKNDASCNNNATRVKDPLNFRHLIPTCPSRTEVFQNNVTAWNGMIRIGVDTLTVPPPEEIDPISTGVYWSLADLRLMLRLDSSHNPVTTYSPTGVEVRNVDNSVNTSLTTSLHNAACTGQISSRPIGTTNAFYNNRENKVIRMLEIDMRNLLECIKLRTLMPGKTLNDSSEGGLVFYFSVEGPDSSVAASRYGVRIRNAAALQATSATPTVRAMTVVSNQAVYTYGNYNSSGWVPAAILTDSINMLSSNWRDPTQASELGSPPACVNQCAANTGTGNNNVSSTNREAADTSVYTALLAGTDTTGNVEGSGGQSLGIYNGGLENYPRLHEYWTGRTLTYRGSFVSLDQPRHVNGAWVYGGRYYTAPDRNWDYDTRFNDAANLPPLSPRFVYLRQELFVRDFEQ